MSSLPVVGVAIVDATTRRPLFIVGGKHSTYSTNTLIRPVLEHIALLNYNLAPSYRRKMGEVELMDKFRAVYLRKQQFYLILVLGEIERHGDSFGIVQIDNSVIRTTLIRIWEAMLAACHEKSFLGSGSQTINAMTLRKRGAEVLLALRRVLNGGNVEPHMFANPSKMVHWTTVPEWEQEHYWFHDPDNFGPSGGKEKRKSSVKSKNTTNSSSPSASNKYFSNGTDMGWSGLTNALKNAMALTPPHLPMSSDLDQSIGKTSEKPQKTIHGSMVSFAYHGSLASRRRQYEVANAAIAESKSVDLPVHVQVKLSETMKVMLKQNQISQAFIECDISLEAVAPDKITKEISVMIANNDPKLSTSMLSKPISFKYKSENKSTPQLDDQSNKLVLPIPQDKQKIQFIASPSRAFIIEPARLAAVCKFTSKSTDVLVKFAIHPELLSSVKSAAIIVTVPSKFSIQYTGMSAQPNAKFNPQRRQLLWQVPISHEKLFTAKARLHHQIENNELSGESCTAESTAKIELEKIQNDTSISTSIDSLGSSLKYGLQQSDTANSGDIQIVSSVSTCLIQIKSVG